MGQPIYQSVRGLRLHSFENHWRWNLGLTMLIKGHLIFFFFAFGVEESHPFI